MILDSSKKPSTLSSVEQQDQIPSEFLAKEEELFKNLMEDLKDESRHKAYIGYILKSGLLSQGTRRYGPLIDDKENFPIEARRLSRIYQRHLVNAMFLTAREKSPPSPGKKQLGYFLIFITSMMIILGVLAPRYYYVGITGGAICIGYFLIKYFQWTNIQKSRNVPPKL